MTVTQRRQFDAWNQSKRDNSLFIAWYRRQTKKQGYCHVFNLSQLAGLFAIPLLLNINHFISFPPLLIDGISFTPLQYSTIFDCSTPELIYLWRHNRVNCCEIVNENAQEILRSFFSVEKLIVPAVHLEVWEILEVCRFRHKPNLADN